MCDAGGSSSRGCRSEARRGVSQPKEAAPHDEGQGHATGWVPGHSIARDCRCEAYTPAARAALAETLDVVYGGASAAMVDEFCDEQMERKRNTAQDDRTAQPQDDAKEHVARAHAAAAASRTQQRTQHSAAAHTSDGNRQALGHAGLGDAPSSSRDAVSRVPKAVQELDALLASVDAAASVAGEVAAARAQRGLDRSAAAGGGGGGGGNRKTAAARGPPALRGRGSGSHDVSPQSTLHSRGSSDGDISDNGVGSHRATARARESLSIYAQPMLSR